VNLRRRSVLIWLILVFVSVCSACGVTFSRKEARKKYYSLEVERPGLTGAKVSEESLKVGRVRFSPRYEGKALVYRTGRFDYVSDFYNEWFVQPRAMFTDQLRRWMTSSGLFAHVVEGGSSLETSLLLEGSVTAMYGDYRQAGATEAVLEMQFFLIDESGREPRVLFKRDVSKRVAIASQTSDVLVGGWNEALSEIFSELESALRDGGLNGSGS